MEPLALVLGESVVDVVEGVPRPGGSPANVAVALARLGRPVRLGTSFADDTDGRLIRKHLEGAGVRLANDPGAVDRTSRAVAHLHTDGSATYDFDLDWKLGRVTLPPGEQPVVVHAGSYGAVLPPGEAEIRDEVMRFREVATVTYDINARPSVTGTGVDVLRSVDALAQRADVVKVSVDDLAAYWPEMSAEEAAHYLLGLGPAAVVLSRGDAGATWFASSGEGSVRAPAREVVDSIGAGDAFMAGLIDGLWEYGLLGAGRREDLHAAPHGTWADVAAWACRLAALSVSRPGADPPTRDEVQRLLH